uniref:Thioredoxin domain-containing protein n=1 Tax=Rhinolophus ferrumequinum TaxID=59479 RepID=A0A671DYS6_RHIFE
MAQRLLLRRFLASVISRKPPQGWREPLTSRALQTPRCSPGNLTITPSQARSIFSTRVCSTTFNIQDGPDFQDRVVNSDTPVVVDFHAQWCGPCKILGPRLEKVVAKQRGKVVMAKVDIDDHTDLAIEYEVCMGGCHRAAGVGHAWGHRIAGPGDVLGTTRQPGRGGVLVFLAVSSEHFADMTPLISEPLVSRHHLHEVGCMTLCLGTLVIPSFRNPSSHMCSQQSFVSPPVCQAFQTLVRSVELVVPKQL